MSELLTLLTHLGYPDLFLGTLEGETFILVAGFLSHRGYLDLGLVVIFATLGAFAVRQVDSSNDVN